MRDQVALFLHLLDNQFARAVDSVFPEPVKADIFPGHQAVRGLADIGLAIEHVEHFASRETGSLANLEVVEIMAGGDFNRAGTQFRIGMFVGDDLEPASRNRLLNVLADNAFVALVAWVHGNRHIGQHRFRPCGCDLDIVLSVIQRHAVSERIFEMPETALGVAGLDFQIGYRGFQGRVPVDQPLVAIDQAIIIKIDKDLEHGLVHALVHGEALVRPVHRTAQPAQLPGNRAAAFLFPLPDFCDKFLAGEIGALLLLLVHLALDHHLGGDAGVIHPDDPQCVLALQPLVPDDDVLQCIVERVADMQAACNIGRRVDDRERLAIIALRAEKALGFPMLIPACFNGGGVEIFI